MAGSNKYEINQPKESQIRNYKAVPKSTEEVSVYYLVNRMAI